MGRAIRYSVAVYIGLLIAGAITPTTTSAETADEPTEQIISLSPTQPETPVLPLPN